MKHWSNFFSDWTLIKTAKIQMIFLEKILEYTKSKDTILELGAGSGFSSLALAFSNRNIIISDVDDDVLNNIKNLHQNVKILKVDIFDIRVDEKIDCIFHQGLMEHFNDADIIRSLKEQAKVSNNIIFDVPNSRRWKKIREYGNERFLSMREWKKLIKLSGLKIVQISGRRFPKFFDFFPIWIQNCNFIRKWFGTCNIFICKRA